MQKEVIAEIYNSIGHPEWLITAPADFTRELFLAFESQQALTDILFSGDQALVLPRSMEAELRKHIYQTTPELENDVAFNTLITYKVQGGYFAFISNRRQFGDEAVFAGLEKITEKLADIKAIPHNSKCCIAQSDFSSEYIGNPAQK